MSLSYGSSGLFIFSGSQYIGLSYRSYTCFLTFIHLVLGFILDWIRFSGYTQNIIYGYLKGAVAGTETKHHHSYTQSTLHAPCWELLP